MFTKLQTTDRLFITKTILQEKSIGNIQIIRAIHLPQSDKDERVMYFVVGIKREKGPGL